MGILDDILGIIQKPQSIATGAIAGGINQLTGDRGSKAEREQRGYNKMLDDLEESGVDTSQWSALRRADEDTSTLFSGIVSGAKGNLRPADLAVELAGGNRESNAQGFGNQVMSTALNMSADPLLAVGPIAGSGKMGSLAKGAASFGKLPEEASRGQKVAQLGRQAYQGVLGSGGDPMLALGATVLGRQAETRLAPAIARRFAGKLGKAATEVPEELQDIPEGQLFNPGKFTVSKADVLDEGAATPAIRGLDEQPLSRSLESLLSDASGGPAALPRGSTPSPALAGRGSEPFVNIPLSQKSESSFVEGLQGLPFNTSSGQRPDAIARLIAQSGRSQGRFVGGDQRALLEMLQNDPDTLGRVIRQLSG